MQALTGGWRVAVDAKNAGKNEKWFEGVRKEAKEARVPGIIQEVFPDYHGVAWYWTTFRPLRAAGADERYLLTFGAVDYLAEVWVNGQPVGGHEGGETPFTLDVTAAVRADAGNLLAVRVLNPTDEPIDGIKLSQTPHRNKDVRDYAPGRSYNYGGIICPVTLEVVPAVRICDVFCRPEIRTGRIRVTVTVQNDTGRAVRGNLQALAGPAAGNGQVVAMADGEGAFGAGGSVHDVEVRVPQPRLWNLDDPFLYRVTVRLEAGKEFRHEKMVRCGFREFKVERGYFRLNGKRMILRSTHTGNHFPIGQITPVDPDLVRRDLLMAKVAGYNCVRFIAGMGLAEQMDFADEIGIMIYEECLAGWCLENSPEMKRRFDLSVREMILRDRNHPSITLWGLLNETPDGPVFRHAVETLKLVRELDDTRLVLLSSGRWDVQFDIGSVSNPGSHEWEREWGEEGPDKPAIAPQWDKNHGGYFPGAGDAHVYPGTPHPPLTINFIRNLGKDTKPVFLSEYGVGSMLDVVRGTRWFEQMKARPDLLDHRLFRSMAESLAADWKKWGFEGTYAFLGDLLRDSQRLHTRQRAMGFDLIRSNPKICGYNLTGMLDHGITGEGVWTFFREWKPGTAETLYEGWAPLRWCLFADPLNGYVGRKVKLEAVLANEDVLGPGEYPVTLRVHGEVGTVWEKKTVVKIPKVKAGEDGPLAVPVFCEEVKLKAPAGEYEFSAYLEQGGAPFGGRLKFRLADPAAWPKVAAPVTLFGVDRAIEKWLVSQGVKCRPFGKGGAKKREVILVGSSPEEPAAAWQALARQMAQGSCVIFTSPAAFKNVERTGLRGRLDRVGDFPVSFREFDVANASKEDWAIYSKEFWGAIHFQASKLPEGEYEVELGFCEGHLPLEGTRRFDVAINGENVLKDFDIVKEAGAWHTALVRKFRTKAKKGVIDITFTSGKAGAPSLCRLRLYDAKGRLLAEDTAAREIRGVLKWLPLAKKGSVANFGDWLYHKECVAKAHPVFEELQAKGIMDWDYYGPVISHQYFEGQADPTEVIAACFAAGYCCKSGYASGIMMSRYAFGKGNFILNTFSILENVGRHPAADRLLLNLIAYAGTLAKGAPAPLPKGFDKTLAAIGYRE